MLVWNTSAKVNCPEVSGAAPRSDRSSGNLSTGGRLQLSLLSLLKCMNATRNSALDTESINGISTSSIPELDWNLDQAMRLCDVVYEPLVPLGP